jgi:hypothetical protein
MKRFAFLLVVVASLGFAQQAASPASKTPARAISPCVPALQAQMQADDVAKVQLKTSAFGQGLWTGTVLGAGSTLLIVGVVFALKKRGQGDQASARPLTRAASA